MNFYKSVRDQRLHYRSAMVNYTAGYICFTKTPGEDDRDITWAEQYIDSNQIDQRLVNEPTNEEFDLGEADLSHRLVVNRHTISEVLGQYFSTSMRKQKNNYNIPIYRKWPSPLPDVKCKDESADILPFSTFAFNEGTITGTIEIIRGHVERLRLSDEVVRNKIILLKRDLMTISNCRRAIYWRQDELLPSARFHWLEPVAGLFHLQMNMIAMLFG